MSPEAPRELIAWLEGTTRQQSVLEHTVVVGLDWWNDTHQHLPGLPVQAAEATTGERPLSRQEIFAVADDATSDETGTAALRLLWYALAWGTGTRQRGNAKRITAITADLPRHGALLRHAAETSRTDAIAAFRLLRPNRNAISYLGPNFSTKYLYFAGGGSIEHPCVIVDGRVRATLHRVTQDPRFASKSQYGATDYQAALEQLGAWASNAATVIGRPVAVDEVERWAFGR